MQASGLTTATQVETVRPAAADTLTMVAAAFKPAVAGTPFTTQPQVMVTDNMETR